MMCRNRSISTDREKPTAIMVIVLCIPANAIDNFGHVESVQPLTFQLDLVFKS